MWKLKNLHSLVAVPIAMGACLVPATAKAQEAAAPLAGKIINATGAPVRGVKIEIVQGSRRQVSVTGTDGSFVFASLAAGSYSMDVISAGKTLHVLGSMRLNARAHTALLTIGDDDALTLSLQEADTRNGGGEQLSSNAVSEIPLNKRDISALLLLAAGTGTDVNGATNFTQQFAINGQRGVEATFAMDGADTSDPEMGGATFSNFNVDAIQSIDSQSGYMPADIGRGASGFTNITTRSGNDVVHGSFFEFIRNSALDARNYFDHSSPESPGRIPPFRRNEFGLTNGGPVVIPRLYNGHKTTYYFVELQGFRQVLGTTQVFPVPTAQERSGVDTTAFGGDTLIVPVNPQMTRVLARYPLPNYVQGAYGIHTYATSAKVPTDADQFSVRLDHQSGPKNHLFARVTFDNLIGPTTNPDQTVLDPSFGLQYRDHQRNVAFDFARTLSPRWTMETEFSIMRTTPTFHTNNITDPAVKFNDNLFESFNAAGGSITAAFNNLFSLRQVASYTTDHHAIKAGAEVRLNRDTSYFGQSPNGEYDFGGGTSYSPVELRSQSGAHTVHPGDALPDTLSSLLLGSAFVYTVAVAPSFISGGQHIGPAATSRNAGGAFVEDTWKVNSRLTLSYGIRYEHYSPIEERAHRTSSLMAADNSVGQVFLVNPQPPYKSRFEWAPRLQADTRVGDNLHVRVGGGFTTIPPNIWQDNMLTGGTPFVIYPRVTSTSAAPISYGYQITSAELPRAYTPEGQDIFPGNKTTQVKANTVFDIDRYEQDLAALTPSGQINPLNVSSVDRNFGNAYLATWTAGLERAFGGMTADATYVGTAGMRLPRISFPNAYPGADPSFAVHTEFDSNGQVVGGFGNEQVVTSTSHSTYHALQTSLQGTIAHGGPGVQASYTWSKSLDDTSGVTGGYIAGASGALAQTFPQNPFDTRSEKGPSSFDTAHVFTLSLAQDLHLERFDALQVLPDKLRSGWELLSISTITSGAPFTIYSGIQQTGVGSNGVDRPDQIAKPSLSTSRSKREDYFGRGDNNASFFSIPVGIAGGTGPNSGRFGTLGRNTFRGPAYYDFDFSLIKDTSIGRRKDGGEMADLQFRSEFFNIFNVVNMGLPANTLTGSGFGDISRTAGTSRQIQFSLKVLY